MSYRQNMDDRSKSPIAKMLCIFALLILGASKIAWAREEKIAVMVEGYHHFPSKFLVSEYHVNTNVGGSVGFDGDGGDINCCIRIPRYWRPGLTVDVRWIVWDWSAASDEEVRHGIRSKARLEGIYRARVPVERYAQVGYFVVHFFPGGKARVSVSGYWPESAANPISRSDPKAIEQATKGARVTELFTKQELEAQDKEIDRFRKNYGDWR